MSMHMKSNNKILMKQAGFALYFVLIMMIIIAFLVIATMQSTSMDTRTSANDSDHQFALQNAQTGIIAAEEFIASWPAEKKQKRFNCNCENGLCAANKVTPQIANSKLATVESCGDLEEVWKRQNVFNDTDEDPSIAFPAKGVNSEVKYRYVIEYLGPDNAAGPGVYVFRITSKGWGRNASTSSIVEETVQGSLYD